MAVGMGLIDENLNFTVQVLLTFKIDEHEEAYKH